MVSIVVKFLPISSSSHPLRTPTSHNSLSHYPFPRLFSQPLHHCPPQLVWDHFMDAAPPISNWQIPPPPHNFRDDWMPNSQFFAGTLTKNPKASFSVVTKKLSQYNKPLHNKLFGMTSNFPHPSNSKIYKKRTSIEWNFFIADTFCQSLGPLLYSGSPVFRINPNPCPKSFSHRFLGCKSVFIGMMR